MGDRIKKLTDDFLLHLKLGRKSQLTVRNYELYLKRFLRFSRNPLPSEINEAMISDYRQWLEKLPEKRRGLFPDEKMMNAKTKNYHLIALRSFLRYLQGKGLEVMRVEKIWLEEMTAKKREFLSESERERILEAPLRTKDDEIIKYRDKAILELLFATGLKVNELENLKRSDIRQEVIWIRKGNEIIRKVGLTNQARHWIKRYLDRRTDKMLALFIGYDRAARMRRAKQYIPENNLTARSIQRIVLRYSKMAGIGKKITPQVVRNSLFHYFIVTLFFVILGLMMRVDLKHFFC